MTFYRSPDSFAALMKDNTEIPKELWKDTPLESYFVVPQRPRSASARADANAQTARPFGQKNDGE